MLYDVFICSSYTYVLHSSYARTFHIVFWGLMYCNAALRNSRYVAVTYGASQAATFFQLVNVGRHTVPCV